MIVTHISNDKVDRIRFKIHDEVGNFHSIWAIQQTIKIVFTMARKNSNDTFKLDVPKLPWPAIAVTAGLPEVCPDNLHLPEEWVEYFPF